MVDNSAPRFLEPIPNKTVVVGRDVILPCSVDNLKGFKVAWVFVETQTILTIHHTIITKNPRFSLARNDHKHWYLKISDVRSSDRGQYMCQVNSDPMINQVGYLDVQVLYPLFLRTGGTGGRFDTVVTENSYRAYMRLKIKNVQPEDYMSYGCYAKNSLGETNGSIKVYEIPRELMVNPPAPEPTQPDEDQVKLERENQTKNLRPKEDQERGGERRGGRQRFDDDDVVSTMTADGYIEFDVQKLLGKSNRSNRKDPENKTRPDRRGQGHRSGISENHPLHNTPPTSSSPPRPRPGHALNASLVSGLLAAWLLHALAAARQRV
ncbi:uncharacterized protein [Penaeus vannamei]|uniref:uncharacterized protein n=1 Tax=Penaeus vannamei TaxID=6689 RepID=UPI00387F6081